MSESARRPGGVSFEETVFVDAPYVYHPDTKRQSAYYRPHTFIAVGRKTGTANEETWFSNIFVRRGLDDVSEAPGFASDHNAFLEGARPSSVGDEHSLVDESGAGFRMEFTADGATVFLEVPAAVVELEPPWIDTGFAGVFSSVGQGLEDRYGNPIRVDRDTRGERYNRPTVGPLANLRPTRNVIRWEVRPRGGR